MHSRISVLRVQRACLAALLRHWEGRFAQFLSAEQAQLIAGHGEVMSRRQKVRGNLDERRMIIQVGPPGGGKPLNIHARIDISN